MSLSTIEGKLIRYPVPHAHRKGNSPFFMQENEVEWEQVRECYHFRPILHVHAQTTLSIADAQKLVDQYKPGGKIACVEFCNPVLDKDGAIGYRIRVRP